MQAKRKDFAHYVDTHLSGDTAEFVREGIGVESLAMDYNKQIDTFKSILDDVASNTFKYYEITSSIQNKRIDKTDPMWAYLNYLRKHCIAGETDFLEVDMTTESAGSYEALLYKVLVTIDNFLGDDATISYSVAVNGTPKIGSVTFDEYGKPTFTEASPVSL